MTNNQREIIKQIAKYQLENTDEKGIKQKDLLNRCVENMLAHSTKNLKEYLHEAKDHKIIQERFDETGATVLSMSYPTVLLQKIVDDELQWNYLTKFN